MIVSHHSQALGKKGVPLWRYGRAWLSFWKNDETKSFSIVPEWHFFRPGSFRAEITIGGEDSHQLMFTLTIPYLFGIYLGFEGIFPQKWFDWKYWSCYGRDTGIVYADDTLFLRFHVNGDTHMGKIPVVGIYYELQKHGISFSINFKDLIFGRRNHSKDILWEGTGVVQLPEADYEVKFFQTNHTWTRPRLPFYKKTITYFEMKAEKGIPYHAGKGENSWDIDDERLYGTGFRVDTLTDAENALHDLIMKGRDRYGRPDEARADETGK